MEYQCLRHGGWQDGHVMFPLLFCFCVCFFGLSKRYDEAHAHNPRNRPDRSVSESWILLVGGCFCLGSHSLWLWTSSILTLATCFMYREASVLGLESWREKQRAAWCQCSIPVGPCVPLPIGYIASCSNLFWTWQAEAVSNYGYMRRQKGEANSAVVKVPLSVTLPCLTVCWSWHFPRQQEQTVMQMVTHCNYRWGLLSQSIGREPRCGNGWLGDLQYDPVECWRLEYGGIKWSSSFIFLSCFFGIFFGGGMACRKDGKHLAPLLEVAVKVDLIVCETR